VLVVFLSVDPARDSIAALRRYVRGFDPSFVGANGSDDELARLASALGIGYSAPSAASPPSTVDHSATVILIDPKARIAGYIQPPFTAAALREDLRQVVAGPTT
jgi:protein SCO1/2